MHHDPGVDVFPCVRRRHWWDRVTWPRACWWHVGVGAVDDADSTNVEANHDDILQDREANCCNRVLERLSILINVTTIIKFHLLARQEWYNKSNQSHAEHRVSGGVHPGLHPDWWVALALGQPEHTHAAGKEHDGQHRRIVHCECRLLESLTNRPGA